MSGQLSPSKQTTVMANITKSPKAQLSTITETATRLPIQVTADKINVPATEQSASAVTATSKPMSLRTFRRLDRKARKSVYEGFIGFGLSLEAVQSDSLWLKRGWKSWNEFCEQEAGISGRLARRLIAAVNIALAITQGKSVGAIVPITESQVLPLIKGCVLLAGTVWHLRHDEIGGLKRENPNIRLLRLCQKGVGLSVQLPKAIGILGHFRWDGYQRHTGGGRLLIGFEKIVKRSGYEQFVIRETCDLHGCQISHSQENRWVEVAVRLVPRDDKSNRNLMGLGIGLVDFAQVSKCHFDAAAVRALQGDGTTIQR